MRLNKQNWLRRLIATTVFAGFGLANLGANANSITLANVLVTGGGPTTWTYDYSFANSTLATGDFFTINDFGPAAVVGVGPAIPPGWFFSQLLTSPNSLPAFDDPSVLNATFTYMGVPGAVANGTSPFSLTSLFGPMAQLHDYTSLDHSTVPAGPASRVIGSVFGPHTVPDGGLTLSLLGFALLGVEGLRRKLSKSSKN